MEPIRIHRLDSMSETIWQDGKMHRRAANDFVFVETYHDAQILLSRSFRRLYDFAHIKNKALLIYTHEPNLNTSSDSSVRMPFGGQEVEVMSVYSGGVYHTPLHYLPKQVEYANNPFDQRQQKAAIFATFGAKGDYFFEGTNRGLCPIREKLALYLNRSNYCDIYGRNWPENKSIGESRRAPGGWRRDKISTLSQYQFCICFENLHWQNYVTEKFWDAIMAGCIPIYYSGSNGLSNVMNLKSALMLDDLGSFRAVIETIRNMKSAEYYDRIGDLQAQLSTLSRTTDFERIVDQRYDQFLKVAQRLAEPLR